MDSELGDSQGCVLSEKVMTKYPFREMSPWESYFYYSI